MARGRATGRDAPSRVPEMGIIALTTLFVAWTLRETHAYEALALISLGAGALAADVLNAWAPAPDARPGVDGSATLGVLALPWTFAARSDTLTGRDKFVFWTCVVAGAVALVRDAAPTRILSRASRSVSMVVVALVSGAAAATRLVNDDSECPLRSHIVLAVCIFAQSIPAVALASKLLQMFPNILSRAEVTLAAFGVALAVGEAIATAIAAQRGDAWDDENSSNSSKLLVLFLSLAACAVFAAAPISPAERNVRFVNSWVRGGGVRRRSESATRMQSAYRIYLAERSFRGVGREVLGFVLLCTVVGWFKHVRGDASIRKLVRELFVDEFELTKSTTTLWVTAFILTWGLTFVTLIRVPTTVHRKKFHVLATVLFMPVLVSNFAEETNASNSGQYFISNATLAVAYAAALFLFAALELLRTRGCVLFGVPIAAILDKKFAKFLDHRDAGGVNLILCHVSLLLACAVPMWVSEKSWSMGGGDGSFTTRSTTTNTPSPPVHLLGPLAGVLTIGLGDTFASVVGTWFGKTKPFKGNNKTAEGTLAFVLVTAFASVVSWRIATPTTPPPYATIALASVGASWLEMTTEQMDNAFVPLLFFTLVGSAGRVF